MQTNLQRMGARSFASVKVAFRLSPNQRTYFGHFFPRLKFQVLQTEPKQRCIEIGVV